MPTKVQTPVVKILVKVISQDKVQFKLGNKADELNYDTVTITDSFDKDDKGILVAFGNPEKDGKAFLVNAKEITIEGTSKDEFVRVEDIKKASDNGLNTISFIGNGGADKFVVHSGKTNMRFTPGVWKKSEDPKLPPAERKKPENIVLKPSQVIITGDSGWVNINYPKTDILEKPVAPLVFYEKPLKDIKDKPEKSLIINPLQDREVHFDGRETNLVVDVSKKLVGAGDELTKRLVFLKSFKPK